MSATRAPREGAPRPDPKRFEQRGREKSRVDGCTHPRAHDHRCAECGSRVRVALFPELGRGARAVVGCCEGADILCWSTASQGAAIWITQTATHLAVRAHEPEWMGHLERAIGAALEEVAGMSVPTRRGNAVLSVAELVRKWRGLPERVTFAETKPESNGARVPSLF